MPMYYMISDMLRESTLNKCLKGDSPYVGVISTQDWIETRDKFDLGIDLDLDLINMHTTKAEVNFDSLTGTFSIPDRSDIEGEPHQFAFVLDEKRIIFIDNSEYTNHIVRNIMHHKKWKAPSLERFIYDFLEEIIGGDVSLLDRYETELTNIEKKILEDTEHDDLEMTRLNDIRGDLLDLRTHYEQLLDLGQEFNENENNFFKKENLRYFDMFTNRIMRLQDIVASTREYTVQVRDLYQTQISAKQNRIMTVLTVVTTIFSPLTLIVGWYGMNFKYMPEFDYEYSYPIVIIVCIVIVVGLLIFFKKKKFL